MASIQHLEELEAQVVKIKEEHKRCKDKTLRNLDKLYELFDVSYGDSEEETVARVEAAVQV